MLQTPAAYGPHEGYIAAARPRAQLWRLAPAALVIIFFYVAPVVGASTYLALTLGPEVAEAMQGRVVEGAFPGTMLIVLYSFTGLALGTLAAVRLVHRRGAGTLFGPSPRATAKDFLAVILPLAALHLLVAVLALSDSTLKPGLTFIDLLAYLPFALPGILIQSGAEELLFRGYLQQQFAARFRSPLIWMGVPSALFASGHYLPDTFGGGALAIVLWAFLFGCLAADLTARTGNIGAALALHAANNASAMLIIGLDGNLDGLALWTATVDMGAPDAFSLILAADFLMLLSAWLVARIALRR
ncbi:MAG: CPBP family intramembrane metalloprotease [Proteobacteria bacterium]|nr:CPBP family intramembrane metalloprotease [Pseudomonadota bacterium]